MCLRINQVHVTKPIMHFFILLLQILIDGKEKPKLSDSFAIAHDEDASRKKAPFSESSLNKVSQKNESRLSTYKEEFP